MNSIPKEITYPILTFPESVLIQFLHRVDFESMHYLNMTCHRLHGLFHEDGYWASRLEFGFADRSASGIRSISTPYEEYVDVYSIHNRVTYGSEFRCPIERCLISAAAHSDMKLFMYFLPALLEQIMADFEIAYEAVRPYLFKIEKHLTLLGRPEYLQTIRHYLRRQNSPVEFDGDGAIYAAARMGREDLLFFALWSAGASLEYAMDGAVRGEQWELLEKLKRFDPMYIPLKAAIKGGFEDKIKDWLEPDEARFGDQLEVCIKSPRGVEIAKLLISLYGGLPASASFRQVVLWSAHETRRIIPHTRPKRTFVLGSAFESASCIAGVLSQVIQRRNPKVDIRPFLGLPEIKAVLSEQDLVHLLMVSLRYGHADLVDNLLLRGIEWPTGLLSGYPLRIAALGKNPINTERVLKETQPLSIDLEEAGVTCARKGDVKSLELICERLKPSHEYYNRLLEELANKLYLDPLSPTPHWRRVVEFLLLRGASNLKKVHKRIRKSNLRRQAAKLLQSFIHTKG